MKKLFAAVLLISMIFTGCQQNNFSEAFEPETAVSETTTVSATTKFDVKSVPVCSGSASVEINQNKPYFSSRDKTRTDAFENYSELDSVNYSVIQWPSSSLHTDYFCNTEYEGGLQKYHLPDIDKIMKK